MNSLKKGEKLCKIKFCQKDRNKMKGKRKKKIFKKKNGKESMGNAMNRKRSKWRKG